MSARGEYVATSLTIIALLLEIFVLVSCSGNLPVLRDVYFAKVNLNGKFTRLGLWGSCYGSNGVVDECSTPSVPFKWYEAEGLDTPLQVNLPTNIYLAIFILFWLAFLATALAMQATVFTFFKRLPGFILAVVSLMATGALFIIFVIVVIAASKFKDLAGEIGPGTWLVLGAMIASGLATGYYAFACVRGRHNKTARDTFKY